VERIDSAGTSSPFGTRRKGETRNPAKTQGPAFLDVFGDARAVEPTEAGRRSGARNGSGERDLEELLDTVYESGERVKKNPDRETVLAYKAAVHELVRLAVERSLRVEETTSSPNILRQKRFTLVQVIDRKLDRLVSEVLQSQRGNLEILGRIDEINGLLVDLTS
jgi:uncharacterized protein